MDKLEKLLEYVTREENERYDFSHEAAERGNQAAFLVHNAEATAFQRVRYAIEGLMGIS